MSLQLVTLSCKHTVDTILEDYLLSLQLVTLPCKHMVDTILENYLVFTAL